LFKGFSSPEKIQAFLDQIPYSIDHFYRCPERVVRDKKAHCFDGAIFAAAALRNSGYRPLLMQLRAVRDDDHILALFKYNNYWGAIGKSNCAGLRFREPIFRTLRELALSYFEFYFNTKSEKTLRAYSGTLNLSIFDKINWIHDDAAMELIAKKIDKIRHYPILTLSMVRNLIMVDKRTYAAGMLGADERGLYQA